MNQTGMKEYQKKLITELDSEYCIYGRSHAVRKICETIKKIAAVDSTVLVTGESGTGKELVANAIHMNSKRSKGPFVKINCAALNDNLLESELFGHVRGAFTGAYADKIGKFEAASGGTIFLDEIGDISVAMQVKLLRVLQEREFERVGETKTRRCDARVICATNRDLSAMIDENKFRLDLYYRLNVVNVYLPSLKERREDIAGLVNYFINKYNERENSDITGVSAEVLEKLKNHDWPGNVRELENVIEAACVMASSETIEQVWLNNKSKRPVVISGSKSILSSEDRSQSPHGHITAGFHSGGPRIARGRSFESYDNESDESMDYVSKIGGHFPISGAPVAKGSFDARSYSNVKKRSAEAAAPSDENGADADEVEFDVTFRLPVTLESVENSIISNTLRLTAGNKTHAAKLLGISLRSLQLKLKIINGPRNES